MLIVMVGLQGSGKTTKAKELQSCYDNAVVVSSDAFRKIYPEQNNDFIWKLVYEQMVLSLQQNKTVILDATNITIKSRQKIFEVLRQNKIETDVVAHVMNTPFFDCWTRVEKRNSNPKEHQVPSEVLYRYLESFQIPLYSEGFGDIAFENNPEHNPERIGQIAELTKGFDQMNKHHTKDLYSHSVAVGEAFGNWKVGVLHDVGKLKTQTIGQDGQAHYYNHANVGAYWMMCHLDIFDEEEASLVYLALINYHMLPFDWKTEKTHKKWKNILGEFLYNELIKLHKADKENC